MKSSTNRFAAVLLTALLATAVLSCKKDDGENPAIPQQGQGTGEITLTVAGEPIHANGTCTWTNSQYLAVISVVEQGATGLHQLTVKLNLNAVPAVSTGYHLQEDLSDGDPSHANVSFRETRPTGALAWQSRSGSQTLTLTVNGEKISANVAGIVLEPESTNEAPYNSSGTLSGTFTFNKP